MPQSRANLIFVTKAVFLKFHFTQKKFHCCYFEDKSIEHFCFGRLSTFSNKLPLEHL
jgi:hypothetical protein